MKSETTREDDPHGQESIDTEHLESEEPSGVVAVARDLSKFQLRALAIVAYQDRYGLAIRDELARYYGEDVNHGRLYPNLDQLVEHDLIEKGSRDRRTNNYTITEFGEAVLEHELEWLVERIGGYVAVETDGGQLATSRDGDSEPPEWLVAMFQRAIAADNDSGGGPRSFEHALRLLVPDDQKDAIKAAYLDALDRRRGTDGGDE